MTWVAVATGAILGAWARWGLGVWLNALHSRLPFGTLAANLVGGFLIGVALAFFSGHPDLPSAWRLFLITGLLGGLTTFSSFSAEAMILLQNRELAWAFAHVLLHVVGSIVCSFAGLAAYRALSA